VNPCAERRPRDLSSSIPSGGEDPSRKLQCCEVDGKPTIISGRNTSARILFGAEWFARLGRFYRASSLFPLRPQRASFAPQCSATSTEPTLRTLPNGTPGTTIVHAVLRSLCLNELARTANGIGLTKARSAGYACIPKSRSRWSDSTATPSGSFPGNTWRSGERSRVLTPFREGRSRDFCCVARGRFPDHCVTIVVSREVKRLSVQTGVTNPWPRWTLESTPPNSKPVVPHCPRHSFLFGVAFHRDNCSQPSSATATLGFVPARCPGFIRANPREREVA
jgi:hypothetical protein